MDEYLSQPNVPDFLKYPVFYPAYAEVPVERETRFSKRDSSLLESGFGGSMPDSGETDIDLSD